VTEGESVCVETRIIMLNVRTSDSLTVTDHGPLPRWVDQRWEENQAADYQDARMRSGTEERIVEECHCSGGGNESGGAG
jgi:hypothetical protein